PRDEARGGASVHPLQREVGADAVVDGLIVGNAQRGANDSFGRDGLAFHEPGRLDDDLVNVRTLQGDGDHGAHATVSTEGRSARTRLLRLQWLSTGAAPVEDPGREPTPLEGPGGPIGARDADLDILRRANRLEEHF